MPKSLFSLLKVKEKLKSDVFLVAKKIVQKEKQPRGKRQKAADLPLDLKQGFSNFFNHGLLLL